MDALRIYRTFRSHALLLAARHDVPSDTALVALARAASQCPPDLARFEVASLVRAKTEQSIMQSKESG